jgi:FAD/FMN-containing dehydrogenase
VEQFAGQCSVASQQIAALVGQFNGSISAEHGVGLLKKDYLEHSRSATEVQLMRQVKQVFDPNGIMNPGKIFDAV